jgi:hypothetical protein
MTKTISVCLNDLQLDELKRIKELYEKHQDEVFGEYVPWNWETSGGRRHRVRRERINDSYIIRMAIDDFAYETENRFNPQKPKPLEKKWRKHEWFKK